MNAVRRCYFGVFFQPSETIYPLKMNENVVAAAEHLKLNSVDQKVTADDSSHTPSQKHITSSNVI